MHQQTNRCSRHQATPRKADGGRRDIQGYTCEQPQRDRTQCFCALRSRSFQYSIRMSDSRTNGHRRSQPGIRIPDEALQPVPPLPQDRAWHASTISYWCSMWEDPISQLWTSSDRANALLLAEQLDVANWDGGPLSGRASNEIRQQQDRLGLSMQSRKRLGVMSSRGIRTSTGTRTGKLAPEGFYRSRSGEVRELPATFCVDTDLHTPADPRRGLGAAA